MSIVYDLKPGASKRGLSYYLSLQTCPRKARLLSELKEANDNHASPKAPAVGVLVHAFLELYDTGKIRVTSEIPHVKFTPSDHPVLLADEVGEGEVLDEAQRLATYWMSTYRSAHFGRVVGTEVDLDAPGWLCETFGIPEISGRLDHVTKMDQDDCIRLNHAHGLDLSPGYYIVDHKTKAARGGYSTYLNGLQGIWYQMLWNATHSGERVEGMLFNFIIKTKVPTNVVLWRPPPSIPEERALASTLGGIWANYQRNPDWANASACYDGFGDYECFALTRGLCERH